jgi:hypothetical protein
MGVDVLYYIDPVDILFMFVKFKCNKGLFSVHRFPSFAGSMYHIKKDKYEIKYERRHGGRVAMFAEGNLGNYEHNALDWLEE